MKRYGEFYTIQEDILTDYGAITTRAREEATRRLRRTSLLDTSGGLGTALNRSKYWRDTLNESLANISDQNRREGIERFTERLAEIEKEVAVIYDDYKSAVRQAEITRRRINIIETAEKVFGIANDIYQGVTRDDPNHTGSEDRLQSSMLDQLRASEVSLEERITELAENIDPKLKTMDGIEQTLKDEYRDEVIQLRPTIHPTYQLYRDRMNQGKIPNPWQPN